MKTNTRLWFLVLAFLSLPVERLDKKQNHSQTLINSRSRSSSSSLSSSSKSSCGHSPQACTVQTVEIKGVRTTTVCLPACLSVRLFVCLLGMFIYETRTAYERGVQCVRVCLCEWRACCRQHWTICMNTLHMYSTRRGRGVGVVVKVLTGFGCRI